MGRDKTEKSRKRKHRHDSRHSHHDSDSEDEESSAGSSASSSGSESESEDYSSSSSLSGSESESESLEEEKRPSKSRKKARRSSESIKRKNRKRQKVDKKKSSKNSSLKERRKKKPKAKQKETISTDDYYLKSAEFRTWLSKERGVFFSELTSEESRKLFKKFVNKWNGGLLKKKYYEGIQSSSVGHDTQSKYQWKFALGVDSGELKSMRESVSSWTASTTGSGKDKQGRVGGATPGVLVGPQRPGPSAHSDIGPSIGPSSFKGSSSRSMDPFEREEMREEERSKLKKGRRDFRKHQEAVLEELVPKAGPGREARLEKKKMMAQKRREREISPEMAESTLMGPTANIKEKIRNRQEQRQNRAQAAVQRISDYQAKEKAKMAAILEMAKANKKEGALW